MPRVARSAVDRKVAGFGREPRAGQRDRGSRPDDGPSPPVVRAEEAQEEHDKKDRVDQYSRVHLSGPR
jgi:hypothetical protein